MEYEVIRSRRRTLCAEIRNNRLVLRVPLRASQREIAAFVEQNRNWIEKHLAKAQARQRQLDALPPLTADDIRALAAEARRVIPQRVAYYAPLVGVTYGRITIRKQRTKWGSCGAAGNLNFNCLLMLTPPEVVDCVVVHELCHRRVMNHSDRFYAEVLRVCPEYKKWNRWLRENGPLLMSRMECQSRD
jgi:hypothetical protein